MKRTITIIFFTDASGRARTIEFSLKRLTVFIAASLILTVVFMVAIWFSFKLYLENNRLTDELASIREEKISFEARLNHAIAKTDKTTEIPHPVANSLIKQQTKNVDTFEAVTTEIKQGGANRKAEENGSPVSINSFKAKNTTDNSQMVVGFDLVKNNNTGAAIHGYVFIIVGDYRGIYFSFPEGIEMEDGIPVDFRKGDRFAIKWQRHVERIFPLFVDTAIKMVRVFVYSADGDLLIKKEAGL